MKWTLPRYRISGFMIKHCQDIDEVNTAYRHKNSGLMIKHCEGHCCGMARHQWSAACLHPEVGYTDPPSTQIAAQISNPGSSPQHNSTMLTNFAYTMDPTNHHLSIAIQKNILPPFPLRSIVLFFSGLLHGIQMPNVLRSCCMVFMISKDAIKTELSRSEQHFHDSW